MTKKPIENIYLHLHHSHDHHNHNHCHLLFSPWWPGCLPGLQPPLPHAACCGDHFKDHGGHVEDDDDDDHDGDDQRLWWSWTTEITVRNFNLGDLLLCLHAPSCLSNQCNCIQSFRFHHCISPSSLSPPTSFMIIMLKQCYLTQSHDSVESDPLWYQLLWVLIKALFCSLQSSIHHHPQDHLPHRAQPMQSKP